MARLTKIVLLVAPIASIITAQTIPACPGSAPLCSLAKTPGTRQARRRCAAMGTLNKPTESDAAPVKVCVEDDTGHYNCPGYCTAASYSNCRDLCLESTQQGTPCKTFGYDTSSGLCTTSSKIPQKQGFVQDRSSQTLYTNGQCFDASYYLGSQAFNFDGQSGSGRAAVATVYGQTLQPVFQNQETTLAADDACGAAEACNAYAVGQGYTSNAAIEVHYDNAGHWECTGWHANNGVPSLDYEMESTSIGNYYAFSAGQQQR